MRTQDQVVVTQDDLDLGAGQAKELRGTQEARSQLKTGEGWNASAIRSALASGGMAAVTATDARSSNGCCE